MHPAMSIRRALDAGVLLTSLGLLAFSGTLRGQSPRIATPQKGPRTPVPVTQAAAAFAWGPFVLKPTPVREDLVPELDLNVKNTAPQKMATPTLHVRVQPLDGGTCPGSAPGAPLVTTVKHYYSELSAGEPDVYRILNKGRYTPGQYKVTVSLAPTFTPPLLPDFTFKVDPAPFQLIQMTPSVLPVSTQPTLVSLMGNGFQKGCSVALRKEGSPDISLPTFHHDAQQPLRELKVSLPPAVMQQAGNYWMWVHSHEGKDSQKLAFSVAPPHRTQPRILSASPSPVSWILEPTGKDPHEAWVQITGQDLSPGFWQDLKGRIPLTSTQAVSVAILGTPDPKNPSTSGTLHMSIKQLGWTYDVLCENRVIEIYAPGQAQPLFKIPSLGKVVTLNPPTILHPKGGSSIRMQPVVVELAHPHLPAGTPLELLWEFLPYAPDLSTVLPKAILPTAVTGPGGKTSLTIPTQRFQDSGTYRLAVRVKGPQAWSEKITFVFERTEAGRKQP